MKLGNLNNFSFVNIPGIQLLTTPHAGTCTSVYVCICVHDVHVHAHMYTCMCVPVCMSIRRLGCLQFSCGSAWSEILYEFLT